MFPLEPSCFTTHNTLPLNADFTLLLYFSTQVALPLSVPTIVPPSTVKVILLFAVGTITPFSSIISQVINVKSSEFILTLVLSVDNLVVVGIPCEVYIISCATISPF